MTYTVTEINELYDAAPGRPYGEVLAEHLNSMEEQGWAMVTVVQDHQLWNEEGYPDGRAASMVIWHKVSEPTDPGPRRWNL